MRGRSQWPDGRRVALLFAATSVLPSLVLAVLAYRALDADRQLAWIPDGHAPAAAALPPELEAAENQELRQSDAKQAVSVYGGLLHRAAVPWRG